MKPKAQATKTKINIRDYIKNNFCIIEETRVKRQPREREKIFVNNLSDKWLTSKIYKKLLQLISNKNNNNLNKTWA